MNNKSLAAAHVSDSQAGYTCGASLDPVTSRENNASKSPLRVAAKTFLTVFLLGSTLFGQDCCTLWTPNSWQRWNVPLHRRRDVSLGVVGQKPAPPEISFDRNTAITLYSGSSISWDYPVQPYLVPEHYECNKSGYAAIYEKFEGGYSIACKKLQ